MAAGGGAVSVAPTSTTTYTATATGAGGTASASVTITVTTGGGSGAPTVAISANPTSITSGNSSVLTVTATNATGTTITGTDGSSDTLGATGGTVSVSPDLHDDLHCDSNWKRRNRHGICEGHRGIGQRGYPTDSGERRHRRWNCDQQSGWNQLPGNLHSQLLQRSSRRIDVNCRFRQYIRRMVGSLYGFDNLQPDNGGQYYSHFDLRARNGRDHVAQTHHLFCPGESFAR